MNERTEIAKDVLIALLDGAAEFPAVSPAAVLAVQYADALLAELAREPK